MNKLEKFFYGAGSSIVVCGLLTPLYQKSELNLPLSSGIILAGMSLLSLTFDYTVKRMQRSYCLGLEKDLEFSCCNQLEPRFLFGYMFRPSQRNPEMN
jgi:hypothetical protein